MYMFTIGYEQLNVIDVNSTIHVYTSTNIGLLKKSYTILNTNKYKELSPQPLKF